MTGILLSLLLMLLGAPAIENADEVTVVFADLEDGHAGAACDSAFGEIPGNIQGRYCDWYEDGTVLIDSAALWTAAGGSPARYRYLMLTTLGHEAHHLAIGPDPDAPDPFNEDECSKAGAEYAMKDYTQRSSAVRALMGGTR